MKARGIRVPGLVLAIVAASALALVAPLSGPADATTCVAGTATSNPLGAATGWTEFVKTDGNRGAESEGSIAYGGSFAGGGFTVGTHLPVATPTTAATLVVVGSHGTYNLQRGSAYLNPQTGVNFNGGGGYLASNPVGFAAAFTDLEAKSAAWGAAAATGTVTLVTTNPLPGGQNTLVLSGSNPSLNVFTLPAASLGSHQVGIDVPQGSTVLVNVTGAAPAFNNNLLIKQGASWDQASDNVVKPGWGTPAGWPGILWNFPTATSVSINSGSAFAGTVLAPLADVTVGSAGHTIGQMIAKSFTSSKETHFNLFPSEPCLPPPPPGPSQPDVTITKTASNPNPNGGSSFSYTLLVKNVGSATATGVVATDVLPTGVTFVAAPGCSYTGATRTVTCSIGTLAAGASVTRLISVTADPIAGAGPPSHPQATHWLTPYKLETQVSLAAGEQRTVSLSCAPGDILSDGTFRVDAVDQGTGTLADVKVLGSQANPLAQETWRGVIRNQATGQAQAKAFIVCIPGRTEAADRQTGYHDSHRHDISVDPAVVLDGGTYDVGRPSTTLTCPVGTKPIAPGYDVPSGAAVLVGSEPTGPRSWVFTLDVTAPSTAVGLSLRCLRTTTSAVHGHTHDLQLAHVVRSVVVPAGASVSERVACADDAKGVVATWSVPPGVNHDGNDPQLKSRDFRLHNTTGAPQTVTIDLECLRDRTTTEQMGQPDPVPVPNVATVSSTSSDANALNNSSTATVTVHPAAVTASAIGSLRMVRGKAVVKVASAVPGKGAVKVRVGKRVVARGVVRLRAGKVVLAKVSVTKVGKRVLKRAHQARVVVDPTRGKAVVKVLKVR
jgi:choice-of-anchor A domain-containing protein/uncharacterized repeat protein (TIGR01451 family)